MKLFSLIFNVTIAVFGLRIIQKLATIYLNPVTNHTMHDSKHSMIWWSSLSSKTRGKNQSLFKLIW